MRQYITLIQKTYVSVIKSVLFSIYLLSSTPFFILFFCTLIVGCFHEAKSNYIVIFCEYFANSLLIIALILPLLFLSKPAENSIKRMVGSSFLDNYYPSSGKGFRGLKPLIVFGLTVFTVLFVEYLSFEWTLYSYNKELLRLESESLNLYKKGEILAGNQNGYKIIDDLKHYKDIKGFFTKWVNTPKITSFLDYFGIEK